MRERYDMDHVYYIDGKAWHGSAYYDEYPCVFAWVLMHDYLGRRFTHDADLLTAPCMADPGTVRMEAPGLALNYVVYVVTSDHLLVTKLAAMPRIFLI